MCFAAQQLEVGADVVEDGEGVWNVEGEQRQPRPTLVFGTPLVKYAPWERFDRAKGRIKRPSTAGSRSKHRLRALKLIATWITWYASPRFLGRVASPLVLTFVSSLPMYEAVCRWAVLC